MPIAAGDWRDVGFYDRLLLGDRRCFAWEWLRRTPAYVDAWVAAGSPLPFGLVRLEDPSLDAVAARPIWSTAIDGAVLHATGQADPAGEILPLARLGPIVTTVPLTGQIMSILFSDGLRSIRVDVDQPCQSNAPIAPVWHLAGVTTVGGQLRALGQLAALCQDGRFSRTLHPRERRAPRWIAALRVHDALATGVSNRAIVAELFRVATNGARWRTDAAPWRLRVQRLASVAKVCIAQGPRGWIGPANPRDMTP